MSFYIYRITNKINNKHYIGQSIAPKSRWGKHKHGAYRVKSGATINDNGIQVIHLALAKYGADNFVFEIIEEVDTQEQANERETYWVSYYDSLKSGYNCTRGGFNAPKTEEWKRKVKETRMANGGYGHSEETKKRMSDDWPLYHTQESIQKTAKANLGRVISDEHRRKLSEANKGKQYCLGHKQPQEVIEKRMLSYEKSYGSKVCNAPDCYRTDGWKIDGIRYCVMHAERLKNTGSLELGPRPKPNLGKTPSKETRDKISKSRSGKCVGSSNPFYGKKHNKETMERIRKANLGKEPPNKKRFSQEDIIKIVTDIRAAKTIGLDFDVSARIIRRVKKEYIHLVWSKLSNSFWTP